MAASLDPLRYGVRALEEMAREQASVAPPLPARGDVFSPHPTLRPAAREGAAFSLRLFGDTDDDATAFVLGDATTRRFAPIPARAAALFEAHAAILAVEGEDALTIGFPLVTFVQQGSTRAAPLFSCGGARAKWLVGEAAWKLPAGARDGAPLTLPDALVLGLADDAAFTLHAGVWHHLFGLDGSALGAIATAGRASLGALVRAATHALTNGAEELEAVTGDAPLTRDELTVLTEAARLRAAPSRGLRCHPHGLAMLPPRGDPTSGLRTDLNAVLDEKLPPRGPLAVYLGARGAAATGGVVYTSGRVPPTPSQLAAARAFEGSDDIVAVCGPPGCGKTALLHQITAQAVVACAAGPLWTKAPGRVGTWPLVVASTNNAAVDQALAPFVVGPGLPVGLRLGSRRALAQHTAPALDHVMTALETAGDVSLAEARDAFESHAARLRSYLREREATRKERSAGTERRRVVERRIAEIEAQLAATPATHASIARTSTVSSDDLDAADTALREHAEAAAKLVAIHLEGPKASVPRACEKWARANELRGPRIVPVLAALGLATPFGDLDPADPRADSDRQARAIEATLAELAGVRATFATPALHDERATLALELGLPLPGELAEPALEPALYDAALAVRLAWAQAHRDLLLPRLVTARDAARGEWSGGRGKPLPLALREIASLFPLVGCTLLSMRSSFPLERDLVDRLVIDEAAQCAPIYAVPALARARRALFTGDVAQLPPVYTLDARVDDRLARGLDEAAIAPFRMSAAAQSSAQAVAEPRSRARLTLTEHFRSQPEIVALASRWSGYSLDVRTPARSLSDVSPRLHAPVIVLPVPGAGTRAAEGVVNEAEASRTVLLVLQLVADGVPPSDIAVLTPFVGQCVRIERALGEHGLVVQGGVLVSTVHRLQGGERRVVVFSVTATERRHLRWLAEQPHLLHVATSRAQDHLVVLVDPSAAAREPALLPFHELLDD